MMLAARAHWLLLAFFVAATALPFHARTQETADVQAALRQGDGLVAKGEFTGAVKAYTEALKADPMSSMILAKRASAYSGLKQHASAIRDLDRAIESNPGYVSALLQRGQLQSALCKFEAAAKDFESVLALRPGQKTATAGAEKAKEGNAHLKNAQQMMRANKFGQAGTNYHGGNQGNQSEKLLKALDKVFAISSDCITARLLLAEHYFKEKSYEETAAETGKILKSESSNIEALLLRGDAYFYLNDFDMAKRHYGEVISTWDPDNENAKKKFKKVKDMAKRKKKADAAKVARDWAKAELEYAEGINIDNNHPVCKELWLGLALARHELNRGLASTTEAADNSLIFDADAFEPKELKIKALLKAEEWDKAVAAATQLAQETQTQQAQHLLHEAQKMLKISKRKDYYKLLNIGKGAPQRDIKKAYRNMAKLYHPDKVPEAEREAAEKKFHDIAEAYEVLGDEENRRRYDAGQDYDEIFGNGGGGGGGGFPGGGFPGGGFPGGGFPGGFNFRWG